MKKIIALLLVGFLVSGCAGFYEKFTDLKQGISEVVTVDNADTVQAAYGSVLAVAVGYRRLCKSKAINKSCWITIEKLQPYENDAYNSIVNLRRFTKENPDIDATTLIQLARSAINAFKSAQNRFGVR